MGGLQINENAQVMHVDGYPIPGLYAAGEVCGGIHGADRLGSCATSDCLTFGRLAGKNVAAETPVHLGELHAVDDTKQAEGLRSHHLTFSDDVGYLGWMG
jgi:succinate dehydrogenase/fumarate reductase flavoprotein subunit